MMICYNCKETHSDHVCICMSCGATVIDTCLACGEAMPTEAGYCMHCATPRGFGISYEDWVDIPAGEFLMGVDDEEQGYAPAHLVRVNAFNMLSTPVTFAMYDIFSKATDKNVPYDHKWGRADRPVIDVSYWDACDYCAWLSKLTGWSVRLPTEAEWEYACRAGTITPFWTGESITSRDANFTRGMTTPVQHYCPNNWGLYDMAGNVWEWCASEYNDDYNSMEGLDASHDRSNGNHRVMRGGCYASCGWLDYNDVQYNPDGIDDLHSGKGRMGQGSTNTGSMFGFRIVKDQ